MARLISSSRLATILPLLLAVLRSSCWAGGGEGKSLLTAPPTTESPASAAPPSPPSHSPQAVASPALRIGCRHDNTSGILHVRPPICAFGQQLTVEFTSGTRCPLYRCEVAPAGQLELTPPPAPLQPPSSVLSSGCPHSDPPPGSCPGLQVVKTLLEPRPGFGWCLSRRCSCPDFDPAAVACAADNRTRPLLAVEKSTGCRVMIECRLADSTAEGLERQPSRCPPPSVPICGDGVEPERLRMPPHGCPLYRCPQPSALSDAADANGTDTSGVKAPLNATICPPAPPCPRGSVTVEELAPSNSTTDAMKTAPSECPRQAICEETADAAAGLPIASCPQPGCAPGELAVPLLPAAAATGRIPSGGAVCPAVACLGLRVPPWLPVCPGAPSLCSIGGSSRSSGLRTELSITEIGALCVRVVCQPLSRNVWRWGLLTLEQEDAAIPIG